MNRKISGLGSRSVEVLMTLQAEIEVREFLPGQKLPTESELAKRFGVSVTTVRRALKYLMSEGYLLARQGSGTFVCDQAPISTGTKTISIMYYFEPGNLTTMQSYLLKRGYLLCVFSQKLGYWNSATERIFLQRVKEEKHRALLAFCTPTQPRNDKTLAELADSGVKVIHVEPYRDDLPAEDYILPDYHKGGHMAAIALMLAGYRQIIYAGYDYGPPFSHLMKQGVLDALNENLAGQSPAEHFFEMPKELIREWDRHGENASLVRDRLERGPVGIVCNELSTAQLMLMILRNNGIRVPDDVAIIGQDLSTSTESDEPIDYLCYDRENILIEAIDKATERPSKPIRKMVAPKHIRRGTVR